MISFFDLYAYSLKLAESICKLWLRYCTWEKFFGTIIFLDNNSRLVNSSCFIKLAVILKKNSKKNNNISSMNFFYPLCFFFYHYLMVSLPFLNCLTLIINVLLTYRFMVHRIEKFVFPDTICQRNIHAFDTQNWL